MFLVCTGALQSLARGHRRGGQGRRRERMADLPLDQDAAPVRGGGASAHRDLRLQLQQLRRHLHADDGGNPRFSDTTLDVGATDIMITMVVQGGLRRWRRPRLRSGVGVLDPDLHHRRRSSRSCSSGRPRHWRTSTDERVNTSPPRHRASASHAGRRLGAFGGAGLVEAAMGDALKTAPAPDDPRRRVVPQVVRRHGWRHVVAWPAIIFALFPLLYIAVGIAQPDRHADRLEPAVLVDLASTTTSGSSPIPAVPVRGVVRQHPRHRDCHERRDGASRRARRRMRSRACASGVAGSASSRSLVLQMFPQLLAIIAIFLLMIQISDVFPAIGLGHARPASS